MFIFQIDATNITGPENNKGVSEEIKNPDLVLLKSLSGSPRTPEVCLNCPSPGGDVLEKIKELSKGLLEDPYHNLIEIPELGKALAKYTNTEYDLGKADQLFNFFLRDKSDLTGDGVIDYQDVIAFWKSLDKPAMPEFPKHVNIDLDNDGTVDYSIEDGKIFKFPPPGTKQPVVEVDSIAGVDLKKLSDEIKEKFEYCNSKPHPMPVCTEVQFDDDINGDGKIDHITADTGLIVLKNKEDK